MRNWTLAGARPASLAIPRVRTFARPDLQTPAPVLRQWSPSGPGHMDSPDRAKALVLRAPSSPKAILHTRPGAMGPRYIRCQGCASAIETSARPIGRGAQMKFSNKLPQAWNGSGIGCRTVGPGPVCLPMQAIQP